MQREAVSRRVPMPIMTQQLMTHLPEFLQQSLPKIQDAAMQATAEEKYKLQF
jgi:hypothetical protein